MKRTHDAGRLQELLADEALDGANCLAITAHGETLEVLPLAYTTC